MNEDTIAGKWEQLKGTVKEQWGKLTDDDVTALDGKRDTLIGKLQERYGTAREQIEQEVDKWFGSASK